jgi:hypothetical protein
LDNDGRPEFIAFFSCAGLEGFGVFRNTARDVQLLFEGAQRQDIGALNSYTNGWRDLRLDSYSAGTGESGSQTLRWNGRCYQNASNPCPTESLAPSQEDPLKLDGTHPVMLLVSVKPGSAAQFEDSFGKVKDALARSTIEIARGVAKSMTLLKLTLSATEHVPGQGPVIMYFVYVQTPVSGVSYDLRKLCYYSGFILPLTEAGVPGGTVEERKKVDGIYNPLLAAVVDIRKWPLVVVANSAVEMPSEPMIGLGSIECAQDVEKRSDAPRP